MKKPILILLTVSSLVLYARHVNAQITNAGFENWTSSGKPAPFNWEEPTGWKSTNSLTEFSYAGCRKTTSKNNGTYALQLQSTNISGGRASIVCNGSPQLISDFSNPDIDIITGGTPVTGKPTRLKGYYRFDNGTANDSGYAVVILKKYNSGAGKRDTVSIGKYFFKPASSYTAFTVQLTDMMPGVSPDSIVIAFYSSDPANPKGPDFTKVGLLIDDISLEYPTSVPSLITPVISLHPNPVTTGERVTLKFGQAPSSDRVDIYDLSGRMVHSGTLEQGGQLDISLLQSGIYFLRTQHGFSSQFTRLVKN